MHELPKPHLRLMCLALALLVCAHGCGKNNAHTSKPDTPGKPGRPGKPDETAVPEEARTVVDHPASHMGPLVPLSNSPLRQEFIVAFEGKLANPEYLAMKSSPSVPSAYQEFPEEEQVKEIRAKIAAALEPPDKAIPIRIPIATSTPLIDGYIDREEWHGAIEIPNVGGSKTKLLILAEGGELFFAADVPEDTTTDGYDQFRVYFHLGTIPELKNERVHLSGNGSLRGLRATGLRWKGEAPKDNDERWKKYDISDWNIYRLLSGVSGMHPHRQYELSVDVEEVGLSRSIAFPMRFEVETDPSKGPDGRSAGRNYLGNLGTDSRPLWFVLD